MTVTKPRPSQNEGRASRPTVGREWSLAGYWSVPPTPLFALKILQKVVIFIQNESHKSKGHQDRASNFDEKSLWI